MPVIMDVENQIEIEETTTLAPLKEYPVVKNTVNGCEHITTEVEK